MPRRLSNLAASYANRYQRLGQLEDLDKSLEFDSRALALTPDDHPDMPSRLADLAVSYTDRYRRLGALDDLEKSLAHRTRALELTPDGHPDLPNRLANLAVSYSDRYRRVGELEDLKKALDYDSRALALTPQNHPDMPSRLANLAVSYTNRYRHLGELEDLEKSLEYDSRALALTPNDHPDMPGRLANLAASYTDRYQFLGELEDLEKSLEYFSRAVALTPGGHQTMPVRLASLAVSYTHRYRRLSELDDIEKSLEYYSRALELTPHNHRDMPDRLGNLAESYTDRYQHLGETQDLEKSLEYRTRAVSLTPNGHPDMPDRLANLAMSYTDRYRRLGKLEDLEKSLDYDTRALASTPEDHRDMPNRLGNLAESYSDRYQHLGQLEDLEKALEYRTRAVELTPNGHRHLPDRLANLAVSYTDRYQHLGNLEDLEKSLEYDSRALSLTPEDHPDLSDRHYNLAVSHYDYFQHTNNIYHSEKSLHSFRTASQILTGPPREKFQHALGWAKFATTQNSLNPFEAFQTTINLLPQFIWLGANTTQRYEDLSTLEGLAVNAATIAIVSSQYTLALEWLEHARCVVWNQSLMLRSPLDELNSFDPELAAKLQKVADQLHSAGSETQALSSDSHTSEQVGQERRRLAKEYHDLLAYTRQQPGFEDFLQPMKSKSLIRAARYGPIVVINCQEDRCDALIVLPDQDTIQHLPLPHFTEKKAQTTRFDMAAALRQTGLRERGIKPFKQLGSKDRIQRVLVTLWNDVVKPVLDFLGYTDGVVRDDLPHITWCPTGSLSFLPLHAAGDYTQPGSRVFNYAISSYTPTLTALLTSATSSLDEGRRMLAIGQPNTPRHSPLPGTVEELARLKAHISGSTEYSQLIDDQATTTAVIDAMEKHHWVHLACHAHQNVDDPTKSGFFLHDGTLDLASINRRSFKNK
ncbi:unnamed protein product, partial [Rhizoctonia solani]